MKDTVENVSGADAAKKIKELADNARTCIMLTSLNERPVSARPMGIQKCNEEGRIFFLSRKDSAKNKELEKSDEMQLTISNDKNSEYLNIYGHAKVYRSQDEIDEMYNPLANNWFDGKDDPQITIIKFTPEKGHYWDTKHGKVIQFAGMLAGAVTGKQLDDGVHGDIRA